MELKKVLVAAPTSKRHFYVFEEWCEALSKQTYKNFDVMLVNTSDESDNYDEVIQQIVSKYNLKTNVINMLWDKKTSAMIQHLANCREAYRKYAVENNYDYLFNLDTDVLLPENGIEELMSFDKDQVGYVVHVFPKGEYQPPCVFKEGGFKMNQNVPRMNGLQYYSWGWYRKYYRQLKKVYATGLGVLLVKRKVFENVPFRTHPTFLNGEDLWYYAEASEKGYEAWCYVKRIKHKNTDWNSINEIDGKKMKLFFALGEESANEVKFVGEETNANK